MNSKPFIPFILVLYFVVSFASPCTGEDTKTALTVKNIAFNRSKGGIERIALFCNQSCVPELFCLEGRNPRLVMDMKGVFLIQTKARNISTGGKFIKSVRSYLDKQTKILRIVLDMEPSKYYIVRPMQDPSGNYMLTIKEDTDSPRSQEKRITILHSDLRPGQQEGRLQDATPSPEKRMAVKAAKDMQSVDQGKSQLNAREFAAAIDTFTQILAVHPQDSLSYRLRGNAYDNLGDRQKAVEDWTQAARLGDTTLQSYLDFLQVKWQDNPAP
jgi:tetratricopeptide (TPR) repeat protein